MGYSDSGLMADIKGANATRVREAISSAKEARETPGSFFTQDWAVKTDYCHTLYYAIWCDYKDSGSTRVSFKFTESPRAEIVALLLESGSGPVEKPCYPFTTTLEDQAAIDRLVKSAAAQYAIKDNPHCDFRVWERSIRVWAPAAPAVATPVLNLTQTLGASEPKRQPAEPLTLE